MGKFFSPFKFIWRRAACGVLATALICFAGCKPGDSDNLIPQRPIATKTQSAAPALQRVRKAYGTAPEMRGVWMTNIDSQVLFSTEALSEGMTTLSRLNFNTVYPTVWNKGSTLYPSAVAQRVTGQSVAGESGLSSRDLMKEMLELGAKLDINIIPWLEYGFMAPPSSDLAVRHPNWLTSMQGGVTVDKDNLVWLNPFHPEVQQFMIDLVLELLEKYDVPAVQFDDHFCLPRKFGYDAFTVDLYKRENKGREPPRNHDDAEWVRWRANKFTEFVRTLRAAMKQKKPQAKLSISPNPYGFAYSQYLQDWKTWVEQGLVDEIVLQVYRQDQAAFQAELAKPEVIAARSRVSFSVGILSGLRVKPVNIQIAKTQVELVRQGGFAGSVFFFYQTLFDSSADGRPAREAALGQIFALPAAAP